MRSDTFVGPQQPTAVILFAGGFLFGSFQIANGFEVVKDGLLLIGAIGLFLVAGMLLAKGKKENADEKKKQRMDGDSILA